MTRFVAAGMCLLSITGAVAGEVPPPTLAPHEELHVVAPAKEVPLRFALADVSISLRRTGCAFECPEYAVTLNGDGTVEWVGEKFVARLGQHAFPIAPGEVFRLLELFAEKGYFDLEEKPGFRVGFLLGDDGIVVRENSMSSCCEVSVLTVRLERYVREQRFGCNDSAFSTLSELAQAVDSAASTSRLIGASTAEE